MTTSEQLRLRKQNVERGIERLAVFTFPGCAGAIKKFAGKHDRPINISIIAK
jgi:hypothetical protein